MPVHCFPNSQSPALLLRQQLQRYVAALSLSQQGATHCAGQQGGYHATGLTLSLAVFNLPCALRCLLG